CGLLLPNGITYLKFQFALLKIGATLLTLDTRHRSHELNFRLKFSGAGWLIMVGRFLKGNFIEIIQEIKPGLPELEKIYVDNSDIPDGMLDINELLSYRARKEELDDIRNNPVEDSADATILFTSGTTADPKGVIMSHRARVFTGIRISERMLITGDDVLLDPLPFCHEFGGFTIVSHAVVSGASMVIMDVFNTEEALRLIDKEKVSVIYGVPTMFSYILDFPRLSDYDVSSLRTGYMSGAACSLELVKRVQSAGCNISVAYGLSEAPSETISEYEDAAETKSSTIGKPIRDTEVKIVDDNRREVPFGTPGEIAIRGKNILNRYFERPDLTKEAIDEDGFLYTKDLGKMDERGYISFFGRKGDMIQTGGFNVYPVEVEEVLCSLPCVANAAAIGLNDPVYGESVCACVILAEGQEATEQDIITHCEKQLAKYKVPKKVVFMDEFPLTPGTTKIRKGELQKMVAK
ncbi:MAG: AMP-binding protein, partial [Deltaproteobacteria bacterium]|nr:AMP-binding protein [Deltaproteobacteria bacterium]